MVTLAQKTGINAFRKGEIAVVDGHPSLSDKTRPYWRPLGPGETVYVLNDLIREPDGFPDGSSVINEQLVKIVSETAERFAQEQAPEIFERIVSETAERIIRNMAPGIVEKIIREEIEKLKRESD